MVVFGHGLLAGREMFRPQIDALKHRYRCVSVDWPGHGDTGFRSDGWTMWDMGRDAAALVEHLGEEQAVFAGLSQGGMAFMRLALERPRWCALWSSWTRARDPRTRMPARCKSSSPRACCTATRRRGRR
jgi:pimeloyl-ACP methyl ester carboxylesterase